jgi:para-nitrobenzyl esterase
VQFAGPWGGADGAEAGEPTGDEDCLHLAIYAPRFEPGSVPRGPARLPVMVWIHGGGNSIGDATIYDGSRLALAHDLIVVTIHYRLGVLGWFAHPALRGPDTSPDDRSGNYGTLDLIRALEWVQQNIEAFGGDPDRVTIFGESAGGTNVFSLLLSARAANLFHRAISQSGGAWTYSMAEAENPTDAAEPGHEFSSSEVLLEHLVRDGRGGDREGAKAKLAEMSDREVEAYLRGKSAREVLAVFAGSGFVGMYSIPTLLRDGVVLPEAEPQEVFANADRYNAVPVILGTNRDEAKLFLLFSSPAVTRLFGLPLWLNDGDLYDATAEYQTLMWKATGVDEPAAVMRSAQGPNVFAYRFDWDEEPTFLWSDLSKMVGAAHAIEIPFVFGYTSLGPATRLVFDESRRAGNEQLSRRLMSYWAQFAHTGDPARGRDGRQLRWQPWSGEGEETDNRYIVFDSEEGGGLRMSPQIVPRDEVIARVVGDARFPTWRERCAVFRSFVKWSERMDEAEYESVGGGACRAHPLDADP